MKHFIFAFFFIILGLGREYAHAQDDTSQPETTNPTVAQEEYKPNTNNSRKPQKHESQNNNDTPPPFNVNGKEVSVPSRSDELSEQANRYAFWQTIIGVFTLVLAGIATCFAIAAWWESRKGVNITNRATELEYKPYLEISPITLKNGIKDTFKVHHVKGRNHVSAIGSVTIKNTGRSPLITRTISGNMTVDFIGIQEKTIKQPVGKSDQVHEVAPNGGIQELTIFCSFNLPKKFAHMDTVDLKDLLFNIRITLKYDDMFSIGTKHFKYIHFSYWGMFSDDGGIALQSHGTSIRKTDVHKSKWPEKRPKRKEFKEATGEK